MNTEIYKELTDLIGKIIRVDVKERKFPHYGKLIEVQPYWITIEMKSGNHFIISKGRIVGIELTGSEAWSPQ